MIVAALALAGCGGDGDEEPVASDACASARPGDPRDMVDGLLSPIDDTVVGTVGGQPDRLQVSGFVAAEPAEFLTAVRSQKDFSVVFAEKEADEAEMLFGDGDHSNFWRVREACEGGSTFEAAVAPGSTPLSRGDLG